METYDVRRLALVLAVQAEIDGMKAENKVRELNGMQLAYNDDSFNIKAEELRDLAHSHDNQLFG